ncbi:hypothetical protein [Halorhabdus amylolytica]|uniref:hypothetical protein n=1 Tax=Halorhabdus amylolytica TaxID=2559573 RepID=UPI0010AA4397|nr:hypothetical protein [Halorhabdus amylolytica]
MDEKTDDLRELFVDVAGTDTVTEDQEVAHGALSDPDEETVEAQLRGVVDQMRERFSFETDLGDDKRVKLVRRFYRGDTDVELADRLSIDERTVVAARLELHLFRDSDNEAPIDWETLRGRLKRQDNDEALAEELGLDRDAVARYRRVLVAREEARGVSHRFRSAFRDVLPDADLADRLTADVTEDGLEEAVADIETDVSF